MFRERGISILVFSMQIIYTTWKYIHDHNLIHPEDPEMIIADDVFAFVAGRDKIFIYEVTISF